MHFKIKQTHFRASTLVLWLWPSGDRNCILSAHERAIPMRARACPPTSQMGLCQGSSLVPVLCCFGGLESLTPSLEQNMPWHAQPLLSIPTHSYPLKLPNRALLQASSLLADFPCFLLESPLPRPENKTTVLLRHPNIPLGVGTAYTPRQTSQQGPAPGQQPSG